MEQLRDLTLEVLSLILVGWIVILIIFLGVFLPIGIISNFIFK